MNWKHLFVKIISEVNEVAFTHCCTLYEQKSVPTVQKRYLSKRSADTDVSKKRVKAMTINTSGGKAMTALISVPLKVWMKIRLIILLCVLS